MRRCRINFNALQGVWAHDGGGGTVENCDLTGNGLGAVFVGPGCHVIRAGNRE